MALQQLPPAVRPAFAALWSLDLALADVVATSSDPRLGAIRLAWWRERLEELDRGKPPPAEPRLRAAAAELIPRGITGKALSELEDAWLPLLGPFPWGDDVAEGLKLRGRILFGIGARLLGAEPQQAEAAGSLWSLADAAQHCSDDQSREFLLDEARKSLGQSPRKLPRQVRPLTVVAALAAIDVVREGSGLTRLSAALRHRLLGTLPRG
ncbi:MAG: squalene/phytoene synthase family protein [Sphingomicrobium sp.]